MVFTASGIWSIWTCFFCSLLASLSIAAPGDECWSGAMTREVCCDTKHGKEGLNDCWDATFTFSRCCLGVAPPYVGPKASTEVAALKLDPRQVPTLPLLGGGKMPIAGMGLCCRPSANGDAVRQGVLDFLIMGGRHLDDAQLYQNQAMVGQGIREAMEMGVPREDIFLTTKIFDEDFGFEPATAWVPQMLGEFGLEYVDLVLLHWAGSAKQERAACATPKACRQETWLALQRAQAKGQIKHLGVSNFGPRQMQELQALGGAPITTNQLEYHPWAPPLHHETVDWCHKQGIAVTAYGSMGSGGMAGQILSQDALKQIGSGHGGKTAGQVLLRWAVQKNVSVIPGTSNPKHLAENMRVFDFELSPEEMALLDSIPEDQRMCHFNHWPDQRP